jgi:UDP-2,3-diacylglucosamine pyrophosphatase LpxH
VGHKLKFILSDLHIGAAHLRSDNFLYRDFRAADEFITLLQAIRQESERDEREVELIINGDFLAFLQVPAVDKYDPTEIYPIETYQDSSEAASIKRLNIIIDSNQVVFNALSEFFHPKHPKRHVTIIKGNHDVSLYWPGVKSRLREVLEASGAHTSLLRFANEFVSREQIYVEHGHQRAEKMNGYQDSFDPRAGHDRNQLEYPAGSRFIVDFLNQAKIKWWFVDHVKPVTTLIWYALKWDFDFACQALASFIRHTPALVVSNYQMGGQLPPVTETFLQTLESPVERQQLLSNYTSSNDFRQSFHQQVLQYLDDATVDNKGEADWPFIEVSDDPVTMGNADQQRQRSILEAGALQIARQEGARVVVFGHSHFPVQHTLSDAAVYINTGTWTQDFANAPPEVWRNLFDGSSVTDDKPSRFPYARIEYEGQRIDRASLYFIEANNHSEAPTVTVPYSDSL